MQNEEEGSSYSPVENDLSSLSSSSIDSRKSDKEIKNAQEEESKTQFIPYAKAKTGSQIDERGRDGSLKVPKKGFQLNLISTRLASQSSSMTEQVKNSPPI